MHHVTNQENDVTNPKQSEVVKMINRINHKNHSQQKFNVRRLTAWLCALMMLISSCGVTAFADERGAEAC